MRNFLGEMYNIVIYLLARGQWAPSLQVLEPWLQQPWAWQGSWQPAACALSPSAGLSLDSAVSWWAPTGVSSVLEPASGKIICRRVLFTTSQKLNPNWNSSPMLFILEHYHGESCDSESWPLTLFVNSPLALQCYVVREWISYLLNDSGVYRAAPGTASMSLGLRIS